MARLDIAEKRIPQDGRISLRIGGREVDVRVSTMPANSGESSTPSPRQTGGRLELTKLGFRMNRYKDYETSFTNLTGFLSYRSNRPCKTTTLYGSLTELKSDVINILTVEDPPSIPAASVRHRLTIKQT